MRGWQSKSQGCTGGSRKPTLLPCFCRHQGCLQEASRSPEQDHHQAPSSTRSDREKEINTSRKNTSTDLLYASPPHQLALWQLDTLCDRVALHLIHPHYQLLHWITMVVVVVVSTGCPCCAVAFVLPVVLARLGKSRGIRLAI